MRRGSIVSTTIILGIIIVVIGSAINLIMVPFITNRLGVEAYGFVTLGRNIADYAGIAMLALNSFAARFMSVSYMKGQQKDFSEYYSTIFITNIVIGAVLFSIGIIVSVFASDILNVPTKLAIDVPILFVGIFLSSYLMFMSTAFQSITYAIKRLDIYNLNRIAGLLTQAIILVGLFFFFEGKIWYVGLAYLGQYIVFYILSYMVKQRYVGTVRISRVNFSYDKLRSLLVNGVWNAVNQLGNVLNSGLDLLVANLFLLAEIMGIISITKVIGGLFSTINQTVSFSFQANFLQLYSDGRKEELLAELKQATKICGIFANTLFITFVIYGEDFYRIWVPTVDSGFLYNLTILAIIPSVFEGYISPLGYVYTLKMKNKIPCFVTIIGGVLNVIAMLVLLGNTSLGAYAVLGTTTVIMTSIYLIFNPMYIAKCLQVRIVYFYPFIFKNFLVAMASCAFMWECKMLLPAIDGWGLLITLGSLLAFLSFFIQMLVLLGWQRTVYSIKKILGGFVH